MTSGGGEGRAGLRDSAEPTAAHSLTQRLESFSLVERGGRAGSSWPWRLYRRRRPAAAFALAMIAWLPMTLFVLFGSSSPRALVTYAHDYAVHARALVAIPILVLVEPIVDRRVRRAVRQLVDSHHVAFSEREAYDRLLARFMRWRDAPIVPALIVVLATTGSIVSATHSLARPDLTWSTTIGADGTRRLAPAGWWLVAVSVTFFEMLAFLWLWRWILWMRLMWRVSRMRLRLIPTHPDRSAGLAFLAVASSSFAAVVLAAGVILSATWTSRIANAHVPLERFAKLAVAYAVLVLVSVFVPIAGLSRRLRQVHHDAVARYGLLVERYVARFDHLWLGANAPCDEASLRDLDAQNMADLGVLFERIQGMRFIPIAPMVLHDVAIAIVVPLVPLLLAAMSPNEIVKKLVEALL
jgi:hypothetical protein